MRPLRCCRRPATKSGGEKRAGRLTAESLLAPVINVTGAEATSYPMTPRSPGGALAWPGFDRRIPTVYKITESEIRIAACQHHYRT
jgi:hypothetical protein